MVLLYKIIVNMVDNVIAFRCSSVIQGVLNKLARIRGTVRYCFVVKFYFSWVSDNNGNKWSKDIFIQFYN